MWLYGRDAVRDYWQRQWQEIDPGVEPTELHDEAPDTIRVSVRQVVHDLGGQIPFDGMVTHIYEFTGGLVRRMTIQDRAAGSIQTIRPYADRSAIAFRKIPRFTTTVVEGIHGGAVDDVDSGQGRDHRRSTAPGHPRVSRRRVHGIRARLFGAPLQPDAAL